MKTEEIHQFIRSRRSIRDFTDMDIQEETLTKIIETACYAPSASNQQDWNFIVVKQPEAKQKLSKMVKTAWEEKLNASDVDYVTDEFKNYVNNFYWFSKAPILIIVTVKKTESFMEHWLGQEISEKVSGKNISGAFAIQNLMLASLAENIGTCCLTGPLLAEKDIKEFLNISKRNSILCFIAMGYIKNMPPAPERKNLEKMIRYYL